MTKADQDQPLTKKEFFDMVETILKPSFDEVFRRLDQHDRRFDEHDARFEKLEAEIKDIRKDLRSTRSLMVTKPYLDDKLADMGGRWNARFTSLIEILHEKDVLKTRDARTIQRAA